MAKPAILTVDDDPEVLRSVERDLRKRYGAEYRILRADSGAAGLDLLRQLKLRNDPVALLVADQRMPNMDGVEYLTQALQVFPEAARVLLTAYADTEAAIAAINRAGVNHYLLKPWSPPEQNLYPVLDNLLEEWRATYRPPFEGLRLVGHRWSRELHQLKDFLSRNHVPYEWLNIELADRDAEVRRVLDALPADTKLPVVLFPDGSVLACPTPESVAEKTGFRTQAGTEFYDFVIVGAGPAGLAAAVYGASEGLKTLLIDREAPGGQAGMSSRIENYLGFPAGLSGGDLARRAVAQAKKFGAEILAPQEVIGLRLDGPFRFLKLRNGREVFTYAVLIATGLAWKRLDVPGVDRLTGAGVYYGAAMTEALSCQDEDVFVIGGANSAGQAAMHFSRYARRVTMLVRGDSLERSMSQYLIDQIRATPNIVVETNVEVAEAMGEESLQAIRIRDRARHETRDVKASALFIFIGAEPATEWLRGVVPMDERGFLLAGRDLYRNGKLCSQWTLDREPQLLETGVPGVFVAGDARHNSIKRVASGVGEGSIAVAMVHQHLARVK